MVRPLYAMLGALAIVLVWLGLVVYEAGGEAPALAVSLADSAARAALPGLAARGYLLAADLQRQRLNTSGVARDSAAGQALLRGIIATRLTAATLLFEKGYVDAAEAIALQGAQADFDDVQARALLLEVRLKGDQPAAARREVMLQLLKQEHPQLLCLLGSSFLRDGNTEDAAACFERALKLAPDHVRSLLALANVRSRQGHAQAASALLDQAARTAVTADERAAVEAARSGKPDDALAALLRMGRWCNERWPSLALAGLYLLFVASPTLTAVSRRGFGSLSQIRP
jgi:tetratricopeptide (TPR) repeat protein